MICTTVAYLDKMTQIYKNIGKKKERKRGRVLKRMGAPFHQFLI